MSFFWIEIGFSGALDKHIRQLRLTSLCLLSLVFALTKPSSEWGSSSWSASILTIAEAKAKTATKHNKTFILTYPTLEHRLVNTFKTDKLPAWWKVLG